MADNVELPGVGQIVSTDDAGADGQVQRIKLAMSADGSATHVPADADGLLVNLGANNDVTVAGTVAVSASAALPVEDTAAAALLTALDARFAGPLVTVDPEASSLLRTLAAYFESPRGYDKSLQRQRATVILESGTVTTVTTVGTVTNLSTIDTMQGRLLVNGQNLAAWTQVVRARIT